MTDRPAAVAPPAAAGDWTIVEFDTVESTMDEARRMAGLGAEERIVVRARAQSGGRGRLGRSWRSPPGNVYMTAILRPPVATSRAAEFSLVSAVAMADAVAAFAAPVRLKWPNDVLLAGAKVAGVLLEALGRGTELDAVLIGIGINVAHCPDLPDRPTTRVPDADADQVFAALLDALDRRYREWGRHGFAATRSAWLGYGPVPGSVLTVGQGEVQVTGTFGGLNDDGALRLVLGDGSVRRIAAGEVLG
jgi:BirA family biotin operon repressor/biotin-[acetyl-CoA-carboxylase] ligase